MEVDYSISTISAQYDKCRSAFLLKKSHSCSLPDLAVIDKF